MAMSKYLLTSLLLLILLVVACSDSGDKSTQPIETLPSVSVADDTVVEGGTALFTVTLNKVADHRVTFSYATIAGTAAAGTDFTAVTGSDTITAGETSATVLVATIDDSDLESAETFSLTLSSVSGAEVSDGLAIGTINDNESALVSYESQVRPILTARCANLACHGGSLAGGGFYLGTGATYDTLIIATGTNTATLPGSTDGKVVQPGSSSTSTLYTKTTSPPSFPSRMPSGLQYLSTDDQNLIRDWIDQGALDN
jgi:hypothetical protein